jgi:hypothetical protein
MCCKRERRAVRRSARRLRLTLMFNSPRLTAPYFKQMSRLWIDMSFLHCMLIMAR